MIAKLKKLEAADGAPGYASAPSAKQSAAPLQQRDDKPGSELQMLAVPHNGWLSGPGRRFNCA